MVTWKDIEPGKYYFIQGEDTRTNDKFCYCYKVISREKDSIDVYEVLDRDGNTYGEDKNFTKFNIADGPDDNYFNFKIQELQNPWEEIPEYFI